MRFLTKLLALFAFALPAAAAADVLEDIQQREEIIIGVSIFPPWTYFHNEGRLAGQEIDLGNRIAEDLGVRARFMQFNFEDVFEALDRGDVDMIAAGVAMTPERARRFYFSAPYMSAGIDIAVDSALLSNARSRVDLNVSDFTIAAVEQTLAARVANDMFDQATVRGFTTARAAEAAVVNGEAQAYVASVPETQLFALRNPGRISRPLEEPLVGGAAGFVVRSGEDRLLHFLDAWIHIHRADGFLEDRYDHYFGSLDWSDEMRAR